MNPHYLAVQSEPTVIANIAVPRKSLSMAGSRSTILSPYLAEAPAILRISHWRAGNATIKNEHSRRAMIS